MHFSSLPARLAPAVCVALLWGGPALAAGRDCTGYDSLKGNAKIEAGKVVSGEKKTYFIKSSFDDKICPADAAGCRRKAFLVPGNAVLISSRVGAFFCATYANAKGVETSGWLPKDAVAVEASAAGVKAEDWAGSWIREEAKVTIKADGKSGLSIKGDATFGATDPDRVKRGAVNMGEISGKVFPSGDQLGFAMGDNGKTEAVAKSDDSTCKVWMRRVGAYLLVDDNNMCGGMNVSFRGTYVRR